MFNAFHSGGQWKRANVANRGEKDKGKEGKVIFLDFFANNWKIARKRYKKMYVTVKYI